MNTAFIYNIVFNLVAELWISAYILYNIFWGMRDPNYFLDPNPDPAVDFYSTVHT